MQTSQNDQAIEGNWIFAFFLIQAVYRQIVGPSWIPAWNFQVLPGLPVADLGKSDGIS
jgi:hypothetical protein